TIFKILVINLVAFNFPMSNEVNDKTPLQVLLPVLRPDEQLCGVVLPTYGRQATSTPFRSCASGPVMRPSGSCCSKPPTARRGPPRYGKYKKNKSFKRRREQVSEDADLGDGY